MKVSVTRLFHLAAIITLHVTAAALVLFVIALPQAAQPWRWPEVATALFLSLVLDRLLERTPRQIRTQIWIAAGFVVIILLTKRLLGGGLNPLNGWQVLVGEGRDIQALIFSVVALLVMWGRGAQLPLLDHDQIASFFQRAVVITLLIFAFQGLASDVVGLSPPVVATLAAYIVVFFASGLLALALSNVVEGAERATHRRWAISTIVPIGALLLAGIIVATLLSPTLRQALAILVGGVVLVVGVLLWPLAVILSPLAAALRVVLIRIGELAEALLGNNPFANTQDSPLSWLFSLPAWVLPLLRIMIFVAICLIALLVLRWLARRTRRLRTYPDEERDSVWSWDTFQQDLLGMLKGLWDRQRQQGLLAALRALRGHDSTTRIRRAYVRLLLFAEAREQGRAPSQTPREYEPTAEQLAPHARASVERLTSNYEQARYGPPPSTEQAAAAEQALREIEKRNHR